MGLSSVFELIRETQEKHPTLCIRALKALLDMLQGQSPEGLKAEPAQVIGTSSLLCLAPSPSPSPPILLAFFLHCRLTVLPANGAGCRPSCSALWGPFRE